MLYQLQAMCVTGSLQNLDINKTPNVPNCALGDYAYMYPTTPPKKVLSTFNTNFSPTYNYPKSSPKKPTQAPGYPRKSVKRLNFDNATDTVIGENEAKRKNIKSLIADNKRNQKDIIARLYLKSDSNSSCISPVTNVLFSYLDSKDIYNFSLVNSTWNELCNLDSRASRKREEYINSINLNKENEEREKSKKVESKKEVAKSFKDSNTLVNTQIYIRSPPGTPRTIKFKKFTKAASLDFRLQLSCVRCRQPAKVTKELSGEEWAECSSSSCAFQFCKKCNCERHPQKTCFQYDLEAPSPSKRKRPSAAICTFKSKRNLRRL